MTLSNSLPDKQYYTIGEVSKYCNLEAHTLRYWQKEFSGLEPVTRNGRRYYQKKDIEYIVKIQDLLHNKKYSIRGAREFLQNAPEDIVSVPQNPFDSKIEKEVVQQLDSVIDTLKKLT